MGTKRKVLILSIKAGAGHLRTAQALEAAFHELMAASDFFVGKCGGLTTSECLALGLPMVVFNPIRGQEERNADFLLENGVALRANSEAHLVFKVRQLLGDRPRLARMKAATRAVARPRAAYTVTGEVLDQVRDPAGRR